MTDAHALPIETGGAFSSQESAPRFRHRAIRSAWSNLLGLEAEPTGRVSPEMRIQHKRLPGLGVTRIEGSETRFARTAEQAEQGGDDVILCIARGADVAVRTIRGDVAEFPEGSVHVWSANRSMWGAVGQAYRAILLGVPRARLEGVGIDLEPIMAAGGVARPRQEALLLAQYADLIFDGFQSLSAGARQASLDHLSDLMVLALDFNSTHDVHLSAVKAARLAALKSDIVTRLGDPDLSPEWLASRHKIGTRYVRALFAAEQTSFSAFVREQRLVQAKRLLMTNGADGLGISDIAYRCGFGDLSYFNRAFRQRFGMTPSEMRAQRPAAAPSSSAKS